jgi:broad specificity phosphatase PhoE
MIYVARHGETTWNASGRYQGRLESELSPLGAAQGAALARYFAARVERGETVPARIISSPLIRCTATAGFVAGTLGLPVERDERIIEIAHGSWEGRYRPEIQANDGRRFWMWKNDPAHVAFENGETLVDVMARWRGFAASLVGETRDVLVVTHDVLCRCALLHAIGLGLDDLWNVHVENGAFSRIELDPDGARVLEECHTQHLATLRASLEGQAL